MSAEIQLKNNDKLENYTKIIPISSDLEDKEGILIEHKYLNRASNYLEYAMIKYQNKYYFIDSKESITEIKQYTDDKKFYCPCCLQDLYLVSKTENVVAHLKHYPRSSECQFKRNYSSEHKLINKGKYTGESFLHKELKLQVAASANNDELTLKIPTDYSIEIDYKNYTCRVNLSYKDVHIKEAQIEKQVLRKDEYTKGYRPDLIFNTHENESIYVEITYQTGKTVNEYYDIWKRLNRTVIEVRKADNSEFDEDESEVVIYDDKIFRFLYSPKLDEAWKEKFKIMAELADAKKKEEQKNKSKDYITKSIFESSKKMMQEQKIYYRKQWSNSENYEFIYYDCEKNQLKNEWFLITHGNVNQKRKIPNILAKYLSEIKDIEITKNSWRD